MIVTSCCLNEFHFPVIPSSRNVLKCTKSSLFVRLPPSVTQIGRASCVGSGRVSCCAQLGGRALGTRHASFSPFAQGKELRGREEEKRLARDQVAKK